MPITFEQITGEVVPERPQERSQGETREAGTPMSELEERVRAVLVQEQRRAERLCDR